MDAATITLYLTRYGAIAVFIIVFLEYLNMPGFPAGIIMPLAGICAAKGGMSLPFVLLVSIAAGLCGSWALYAVGCFGGKVLLPRYLAKHPEQAQRIEGLMDKLREKGNAGVFVFKLVPAVRTLISVPAGVLGMNFVGYTLFSALGIAVWNAVFIGAGYFFGEAALKLLGGG